MIGVIVNVLAVALGGVLGTVFSKKLSTRFTTELNKVFGVCAIGMGISSVPLMQNMPAVILAVVAGTALGLACHLGEWISRGGELMEKPIGKLLGERNGDDGDGLPREEYLSLLVTAIVLFCSSGTGIYGCLDAGMTGNATVLLSKSILDFFTAMVFACNLGAVTSLVAAPQAAVFFALFAGAGNSFLDTGSMPAWIEAYPKAGGTVTILQKAAVSVGQLLLPVCLAFFISRNMSTSNLYLVATAILVIAGIVIARAPFPPLTKAPEKGSVPVDLSLIHI